MTVELTDEQRALREAVQDFAQRECGAEPNTMLPREASMAKLRATEVVSLEGMQMTGGWVRQRVRPGGVGPQDLGRHDRRRDV